MYGGVREIELHETIVQRNVTARTVDSDRYGKRKKDERGTEPYGVIIRLK